MLRSWCGLDGVEPGNYGKNLNSVKVLSRDVKGFGSIYKRNDCEMRCRIGWN